MSTTLQASITGFSPLPLAGLLSAALPEVNLYLPAVDGGKMQLYRAAGTPVAEGDLRSLRARGIDQLWVGSRDTEQIAEFLANNLSLILSDERQPVDERFKLLNQVVARTLEESLSCEEAAASVLKTRELAVQMVKLSLRSDFAIRDVARMAKHDFCTFTHSANVACFSTLLARALGITNEDELRDIASAGMLHDLGKLTIPREILIKPGRLTPDEFAIVKRHPSRGFRMLRNELSFHQSMVVYQHHERPNGKGYPVGCVNDEIHPWAKICAVVDVFEALTGKRPYRQRNIVKQALAIMARGSGTQFDAEMLRCWQSQFICDPAL
jgi:HD-GYP domain-containing protein (c-di-GMP phosphodiesterase class II)